MKYGRLYNLPLVKTSVTAAVDLAEILTPATNILVVHAIELGNVTDVGDAQEEMLQLAFKSGQTTSGSGGNSSVTPVPVLIGDAAHGQTVETFNTTKATSGTIVTHKLWMWNVRLPFVWLAAPEHRLIVPPSTRCTLELVAAPADSIDLQGQIVIEIIG